MDKNNDLNNEHNRPDIDEYLTREIMQYYGEDIMNDIKNSSAPPPPQYNRKSKIISTLGVCCAVMFLTGAVIFSGVLFTSGMPVFGNGTSYDSSSNTSHSIESNDDSVSYTTDTDTNINQFSNSASSHSLSSEKVSDTDTQSTNSYFSGSSIIPDTNNSLPSSRIETPIPNSDTILTSSNSSNSSTSSVIVSTDTESLDASSSGTPPKKYTPDTASRPTYYSLPEYPQSESAVDIEPDLNNNSTTNPYDNVTTGKKIRAGLGISLMTLSLAAAIALNKFKYDKEN